MSARQADLKPVYLIISEQRMLMDHGVTALQKRVAEIASLEFNSDSFDGENVNADDVVAACNTLPFASERRLVVVRNVDKMNKDSVDVLTSYAANPSPTTVLAMTATKFAKNLRLYKAVDALGGIWERKAPTRVELPKTVRSMFAERGKEISLDAAELFVEFVGKDLQQLSVEIDKAASFVGERVEVTRVDIEETAASTAERSIFDFTDAIAERDCRRALRLASELIGEGQSVYGLHAMAVRTVRELITAQSLLERGTGDANAIASALGRPSWTVKKVPRQARSFARGELVDLLRAASEAEAKMKTSRDARLVLERWIVKVCRG